jgi:methionyl aminopeptidase
MVLAIEPMVNAGDGDIKQLRDDSYVTRDGSLSSHFENTIAIMHRGARVLTE